MKKETKEKFLKEVNLDEIKSIDKEITFSTYKFLAGLCVGVLFAYNQGAFQQKYFLHSYIFTILLFSYFFWATGQNYKYVTDCYSSLKKSIRNENILEYKIPLMKTLEIFYYKRKFLE